MSAIIGREVVLALLQSYRVATRQRSPRIGTGSILRVVASGVPGGERVRFPNDVVQALWPARRLTTPAAVDEDEPFTSVPDDSIHKEIEATLREVAWREVHQSRRRSRASTSPDPAWTDAVRSALADALVTATSQDTPYAGTAHLLTGLLADDRSDASAMLRSIGVDSAAIVEAVQTHPAALAGIEPYTPLIASLELTGGIDVAMPWIARPFHRSIRRRFATKSQYGSAVLACLEEEMMRQAVRANTSIVMPTHALFAILSLDRHLALTGKALITRSAPFNKGADLLRRSGIDLPRMTNAVVDSPTETDHAIPTADPSRRFWTMGHPAWGIEVSTELDRSVDIARERGHPETGTTHLLAALLDDDGGIAVRLVQALGVDVVDVRDEVSRALSLMR